MALPGHEDKIEAEHLLGSYNDANDYDDNCYYDDHFERASRVFYTQKPPNVLQNSVDWVTVRCAKHTAQLTAYPTPRRISKRIIFYLAIQFSIVFLVLFFAITPLLFSSYSDPPNHYKDLRRRAIESPFPGGANLNNEKVFIATSIYDAGGKLAGGSWGQAMADLIHILGPENVFLSVYEDNADELAMGALDNLAHYMKCKF